MPTVTGDVNTRVAQQPDKTTQTHMIFLCGMVRGNSCNSFDCPRMMAKRLLVLEILFNPLLYRYLLGNHGVQHCSLINDELSIGMVVYTAGWPKAKYPIATGIFPKSNSATQTWQCEIDGYPIQMRIYMGKPSVGRGESSRLPLPCLIPRG